MLNLLAAHGSHRLTRRQALQWGAAALTLPLSRAALAAPTHGGRAKSCIYLFLCGGPSQLDMWDPKPNAPAEIRGPLGSIPTNVPGTRFGELLPRVARHADKLALVRSMTHGDGDHVAGIVHTLLGQKPAQPGDFYVARRDHPGLGGILHRLRGDCGALPPWVVLPRPFGTSSPPYKGQSAGFLGAIYDPVMMDEAKIDSLAAKDLRLDALALAEGVGRPRLAERRRLRDFANAFGTAAQLELSGPRLEDSYAKALGMLATDDCRRAFDLSREPVAVRDQYGRNEYGQSLLLARRLVEAGVRFVNVFWTFFDKQGAQFNLWDNHGVDKPVPGTGGARTGLEMLKHDYCMPSFDRSFSTLLEDLQTRGLLDQTLVAVAGEFGRTPQMNKTVGRDHWPFCYSQVLAGAGVQGGAIHGASDKNAGYVKDLPVTPEDFAATILHAFGVHGEMMVMDALQRPHAVTSGKALRRLFG